MGHTTYKSRNTPSKWKKIAHCECHSEFDWVEEYKHWLLHGKGEKTVKAPVQYITAVFFAQ